MLATLAMTKVRPPPGEFEDAPGQKTESPPEPNRQLRLVAFTDPAPASFELPAPGQQTIGRAEQADIRLQEPSISRLHAAIHVTLRPSGEQILELEDLGSANGTRVRGQTLARGDRAQISTGEVFDVGAIMMMVHGGTHSTAQRPHRLWTHGDFETKLEEECDRAAVSGGRFAILRVRAPRTEPSRVEGALSRALRSFDIIARYAPGEYEMLVVDALPALGEEIRARLVAELGEEQVSIGMACYPSDGRLPDYLSARAGAGARPRETSRVRSVVVADESPMGGLFRLVERVAPSEMTILILGETGVGKEVMAERIHEASRRASKPLVRLNCAALTPSLLESEIFGHERGAFTGAEEAKIGLLESAEGGTVFLDEIGELAAAIQVKLLRVLEERKILRVGGVKPRELDVRFIAATNRDLESDVASGAFRRDLFYRLNGVTLSIPPLRERKTEIVALARAFAGAVEISEEVIELLAGYYWPGNIRELKNVIERAVLLAEDGPILREHVPIEKLCAPTLAKQDDPLAIPEERERILAALEKCVGNQTAAASLLGISRSTLVARLNTYQIPRPRKR